MARPIKVEGNPNHPSSLGSTDVFAQAEVLSFYDPAREMQVTGHGVLADRQNLLAAIVSAREQIVPSRGEGLRLLTGTVTSPTLSAQINRLLQTYPSARWHQWEPFNRDSVLKASQIAYGRAADLLPHLDAADVILGIDSDIIEGAPGWVRFARDFASRRNPTGTQQMSRVYAIEASPTLLGAVADHRFVAGPAAMHDIVGVLAAGVLSGTSADCAPPWLPHLVDWYWSCSLRHHARATRGLFRRLSHTG
jgi:hypothetical protein